MTSYFKSTTSAQRVNKHPEWAKKTKETAEFLQERDEKRIIIKDAIVKTNLIISNKRAKRNKKNNVANCTVEFDWTPYENGWNGKSFKINTNVKAKNGDKVYCHDSYANDLYNQYLGVKVIAPKELVKNAIVNVTDITPIDNDNVMLTINNGSNNVIVDMNKEQKFLNQFEEKITKEDFISYLKIPTFKKSILDMNLSAKITAGDVEKASIWDGYVESLIREMKEQVTLNNKAYIATILSTNNGGFVVDIMNTLKAFMPGSMAAANRVTDFESMIGTQFEVMVDSWDPTSGFVVSRKKYLRTLLPIKISELKDKLIENKDTLFDGVVTGSTQYGVFVEIDEFITGMLHKTLVRDETREAMRNNEIKPGSNVQVYVHKIEGTRVILSDVPSEERDVVIARREAEENELNNVV